MRNLLTPITVCSWLSQMANCLFFGSYKLRSLIMAHTRLTTSWRGKQSEPTTAANCGDNWYGRVKPVPVNEQRNDHRLERGAIKYDRHTQISHQPATKSLTLHCAQLHSEHNQIFAHHHHFVSLWIGKQVSQLLVRHYFLFVGLPNGQRIRSNFGSKKLIRLIR